MAQKKARTSTKKTAPARKKAAAKKKAPAKKKAAAKKKAPARKKAAPKKKAPARKKAAAKKKAPVTSERPPAPPPPAEDSVSREEIQAEPRRDVFRSGAPLDGASARRASQVVAEEMEPGIHVTASSYQGPGLDGEAAAEGRGRLFEGIGPESARAGARGASARDLSLLDRVGELLQPGSYRRMISEFRMRDRSEVVDDFGLDPLFADKWRPLFELLYRHWFRVETVGMENVPDQGGALIVSNHSGTLPYDGAMIMYAVRYDHPAHRDVRPLVEDFIFHFPFLGVFLNRVGCVRACQDNAERLLRQGQVTAVFPEGIQGIGKLYRHRYQLQRFGRGGFIRLAFKTGTPIIPAAVVGAEEIHPMLTKVTWLAKYLGIPYIPVTPTFPWLGPAGALPLPTKWYIRFGEPLDLVGQYGPNGGDDRLLVGRLTERVRSSIQAMVDERLSRRDSVVFG